MLKPLTKRLLPLYIAKFLRNFIFWYAIEKLFMTTIGYTDATIGVMAGVYSIMSVAMEVPSGILADRWSRKGVMILSAVCMVLSSYIGWVSYSVPMFLVSAIFWGFFDALASGTDSAMLYDTVLEEQGHTDNYEKISGRFEAIGGLALIASAVIGGLIGDHLTLRYAFLLSVIPATLAIISLLFYKETKFHKQSADTHIIAHTKGTFKAVLRNPNLIWLLVTMLALSTINSLNGELYQLWYLALRSPATLYGIAGAIILGTYGTGGLFTSHLASKRRIFMSLLIIFAAGFALIISRTLIITVIAQFMIGFISFALGLVLMAQVQRQLPSKYRAGAGSVINSVARLIFIPTVLLFGYVSDAVSVFTASWILVILGAIGIYSELRAKILRQSTSV